MQADRFLPKTDLTRNAVLQPIRHAIAGSALSVR
jgi:hypothetical protein